MISVLKTCISVMKTTTDFSFVSETIVLKLGTLLDNMSGYARAKFHGPHYNSARDTSKSRASQQPAKSKKLAHFFRFPGKRNEISVSNKRHFIQI